MVITETEIWKPKKDYEGLYEVSNLGRVKSLGNGNSNNSKERILKPGKVRGGYLQVTLSKNREIKHFLIHRLVAEAFLPNPLNKPCINHKIEGDEGKKINMVFFNEDGTVDEEKSTIEWATYEENNNYATRNERAGKANTNGKCSKPVLQFSKTGEFIREWPSTMECGRNGFNKGHVAECCRGERNFHKGYIWKYKE